MNFGSAGLRRPRFDQTGRPASVTAGARTGTGDTVAPAGWSRRFGRFGPVLVAAITVAAVVAVTGAVDTGLLVSAFDRAAGEPHRVVLAIAAFALAFGLRAAAWRRVLPTLSFWHALSAIHLALGANHLLPLRLGEPFRVLSVARRTDIPLEPATASTITLRSADMMAVVVLGAVVGPAAFFGLLGPVGLAVMVAVIVVAVIGWRWLRSVVARRADVAMPGPVALGLSSAAWLAESVLVRQAARWADLDLTWSQAVLVTTVAVAAQIAAIAPGGFGTYEAASVAAYMSLGFGAEPALVATLGAHGLKTAYALLAGAVAVAVPAPGFFGRFRLAPLAPLAREPLPPALPPSPSMAQRPASTTGTDETGAGCDSDRSPVLLFMPAHNEAATVGACVRRAPTEVCGRRVEVLVVDDGSTDDTATSARAAGAEVVSFDRNRGLGAAVRVGLAEGVARGAAAVVFCDADGEYPPEEMANLVEPILGGEADYVTGSRFLGRIDHMRIHRRIGNLVLTALLSVVARRRITDGQTGYRAFSPRAAASAEVIHDFNYAQVLTLDLLAKGYRYREVPISYHFRTAGQSFIRPGRYLRHVIPAVYRELNTNTPTATRKQRTAS